MTADNILEYGGDSRRKSFRFLNFRDGIELSDVTVELYSRYIDMPLPRDDRSWKREDRRGCWKSGWAADVVYAATRTSVSTVCFYFLLSFSNEWRHSWTHNGVRRLRDKANTTRVLLD